MQIVKIIDILISGYDNTVSELMLDNGKIITIEPALYASINCDGMGGNEVVFTGSKEDCEEYCELNPGVAQLPLPDGIEYQDDVGYDYVKVVDIQDIIDMDYFI